MGTSLLLGVGACIGSYKYTGSYKYIGSGHLVYIGLDGLRNKYSVKKCRSVEVYDEWLTDRSREAIELSKFNCCVLCAKQCEESPRGDWNLLT